MQPGATDQTSDLTRPSPRLLALYLMLGFSAGLPFYMFNAVLTLRLARHGVDLATIGYFAWVALLPTFKFAWAPLLERYAVPGFTRFWGRERGWIMAAQLGIVASMAAMGLTATDTNLPLTALFALLLAFWTTTLEIAADGWRIELAPSKAAQGPIVASYVWGYRGAMVAAGGGATLIAARLDWGWAYLAIAGAALLPFPVLIAMRGEPGAVGGRWRAFITGLAATAAMLLASTALFGAFGRVALALARAAGITSRTNVTPWVLAVALAPLLLLAAALPRIRRMTPDAPTLRSPMFGPYVDIFWRFGWSTLAITGFVSIYRMGDTMTQTLAHPLWNARGYSLDQIAIADGGVALGAILLGVALGGWMAVKLPMGPVLALGAIGSALGNWIFVWLWHAPPSSLVLYLASGFDQFAHGLEGAVFVVYLSLLVNPRHAAAQYAFLSGLAFLLPRLIAGASGAIAERIGYDGFFLLSGALSAAAILLLPLALAARSRGAA